MANTIWTEGRKKTFITGTLRGGFRKYPPKYECLKAAYIGKKINEKTKRLSSHYVCKSCNKEYPTSEVNVDHINPVVNPETGFTTWDEYIDNMYCSIENLQVLCDECHDIKTREENTIRKETRADSKKGNKKS